MEKNTVKVQSNVRPTGELFWIYVPKDVAHEAGLAKGQTMLLSCKTQGIIEIRRMVPVEETEWQ